MLSMSILILFGILVVVVCIPMGWRYAGTKCQTIIASPMDPTEWEFIDLPSIEGVGEVGIVLLCLKEGESFS